MKIRRHWGTCKQQLKAACLHEVVLYKEALQLNQEILNDPNLVELKHLILNNLANSRYELGLMGDAEPYLLQVSEIECDCAEQTFLNIFNSLFQLAVLEFELCEPE